MNMRILPKLKTKRIVIGITGGIAAYKTCYLIRMFVKQGIEVKTVITENGLKFIGEATLRSLTGNNVYSDTFADWNESSTEHISLSDWGDIFIVAPATANIIGKYANGIADDALSTALLAFDKQVVFAPAMNDRMYFSPAVVRNINTLKNDGVVFVDPGTGDLACGYKAAGRMAEPDEIFRESVHHLMRNGDLTGKKIVISASRTAEFLDPVRYMSNMSSGKTGFKLAQAAAEAGAETVLVTGPTEEKINSHIKRIDVVSAEEMYVQMTEQAENADCVIMSAAVGDYTFERSAEKIKKTGNKSVLSVKPSKDILKELGLNKRKGQILVGYALETENGIENAKKKFAGKNLDMIIMNEISGDNPAFGTESNKVFIITRDNIEELPSLSKMEISYIILEKIRNLF